MTLLQRAVRRVMAEKRAARVSPDDKPQGAYGEWGRALFQFLFPTGEKKRVSSTSPGLFDNKPSLPGRDEQGRRGIVRPVKGPATSNSAIRQLPDIHTLPD